MVAACGGGGDDPSPTAPLPTQDPIVEVLDAAIDDEFHAEAIYEAVIEDFGEVRPFFNIIYAEQRHSAAIARLFANRGLAAPSSRWGPGNVDRYPSVAAACAAGVEAERANIALYDRLLAQDLPADVRNVFQNNRRASLQNHLPAFQRCS
jgi:hypothetical protein